MGMMSLRLPDDLDRQLAEEARLSGKPRAVLVRECIARYLRDRERSRIEAELAADVHLLEGAVSIESADEALAFDNESLEIAEGKARTP